MAAARRATRSALPEQASLTDEPAFADLRQLRALLGKRRISSVELAAFFEQRLRQLGPKYNAVAEMMPTVVEDARSADGLIARGSRSHLAGIPYGVKDVVATAGVPTRWGAPPFRSQVFDRDATVVERLRQAGSVLVAKLSMIELAGAGTYRMPSASVNGAARNPWNTERWTGGSSSGSAAAVAAGLVPFSIGSETRGSIMRPAAFCGVTGLRPSFGLISLHGVQPSAWSMDKIGPMARTARDCGLVLSVIAGRDSRDPRTQQWRYQADARTTFRIGVLSLDFAGESETERAFEEALRVFGRLGNVVRSVRLPDHDFGGISEALVAAEVSTSLGDFIAGEAVEQLIDPSQRDGLREFSKRPASGYVRAFEERTVASREVRDLFRHWDALVAPTCLIEAPLLRTNGSETDLRHVVGLRSGFDALGAVVGLPAVSVPMGFGRTGMPLGISLIGDMLSEAVILRIADRFQQSTDWHTRRPAVAAHVS